MIITVVAIYLGLVIVVGVLGHRLFRETGEDYFVASRSIGPFVLLMTLLGTNLTAFTMLGASGEAYRRGVVVFGLMGASSSIIIPFLFYYLGTKSWWLGKRFWDRFWSRFGVVFVVVFGVISGSFWDLCLRSFWDRFGIVF